MPKRSTTFAVTTGVSNSSILVTENGVVQSPGVDYYISGANVIFTTATKTGVQIGIRELASTAFVDNSSGVAAAFTQANAAFVRANNSLDANNGGTVSGSVTLTGNLVAYSANVSNGLYSRGVYTGGTYSDGIVVDYSTGQGRISVGAADGIGFYNAGIGATALIILGVWFLIQKTRYGLIIKAGAADQEIVKVLGVDIAKVWLLVFGLGCAIAGLSGILASPTRSVNPEMGIPILAESFVVTVVGGMGSPVGAVVAGLLVGVVYSMTSLFFPDLAELSIFVLMAVVLLIRPQGLFGKAGVMG